MLQSFYGFCFCGLGSRDGDVRLCSIFGVVMLGRAEMEMGDKEEERERELWRNGRVSPSSVNKLFYTVHVRVIRTFSKKNK